MYVTHKETYWSGHNELDLKCDGLKAVLSAANSRNTRVFSEFEKWIFRCSFRQFFPKPIWDEKWFSKKLWIFKKNLTDKHRWRCIEEVITRTTRNRFGVMSATWVRIPPSPPWLGDKKDVTQFFSVFMRVCGLLGAKSEKRFYRRCPNSKPQQNPS